MLFTVAYMLLVVCVLCCPIAAPRWNASKEDVITVKNSHPRQTKVKNAQLCEQQMPILKFFQFKTKRFRATIDSALAAPHTLKRTVSSIKRATTKTIVKVAYVSITVYSSIKNWLMRNSDKRTTPPLFNQNRQNFTNAVSDHLEMDLSYISGLSQVQTETAVNAYLDAIDTFPGLQDIAISTDFVVSPHLAYRYFKSVDWHLQYNGIAVHAAIARTVQWRHEYSIHNIDTVKLNPLLKTGLCYTSPVSDRSSRSVVYLKLGNFNSKREFTDAEYLRLLMYSVERADRQSVGFGSGEIVTIIDFAGFSWINCPSVSLFGQTITLMKRHYPYRLSAIYVVNAGKPFNMLWNAVKHIIPKKALEKTFVLRSEERDSVLSSHLGAESIETVYGGTQTIPLFVQQLSEYTREKDLKEYLSTGYWARNEPSRKIYKD